MRHLKTVLAVLGGAMILVLAANTIAMAATGKGFLLGQTNITKTLSTLSRSQAGPALKLQTKTSADTPLVVNGKGKVTNFNADTVDGLDSTALRTSTYSWTKAVTTPTTGFNIVVPLPVGDYVIGYSADLYHGGHTTAFADCDIVRLRGVAVTYYAEDLPMTTTGEDVTLNGTSALNVSAGDDVRLHCSSPANFTTYDGEPIRIWATRTTIVGGAALRQAASSARRSN